MLLESFNSHGCFWAVDILVEEFVFLSVSSWIPRVRAAYTNVLFWCQLTVTLWQLDRRSSDGRQLAMKAVLEFL